MKHNRLTTFVIAKKNLTKRSFRTKSLIVIVAVFTFAIFCGALLSQSIALGVDYMSGRMGADIMVVPRGCTSSFEGTLLRSKSNTFFMSENLAEKISVLSGVKEVSPQLFVASLNAACCFVPVQLIGFEPETDFTIKSWMKNSSNLGFGEVMTGSLINTKIGDQIWLFGQPLNVVATLDDTGMGFNSSIFMTMETAHNLIEMSEQTAIHPVGIGKDLVSALFVKIDDDADASNIAKVIINTYPQTDVIVSEEMMKHVLAELNNISGLIYGIQGLLWAVSILIIAVVVSFSINERKRELGLLLVLGATRKKLVRLLMSESLIISFAGASLGIIAAFLIMFQFRMLIATSLGLPYLKPSAGTITILTVISLLITVITVVIACINSAIRIGRLEICTILRENE